MVDENEKRRRDALIPAVIELVPAAIAVYQGTRIRFVNQALCELLGYGRAELEGMDAWEIVHPDDQEMSRRNGLARQAGELVPDRYELRLITKGGEAVWIDSTTRVFEFEGRPASLATGLDITERKKAEQALVESEHRFHSLFQQAADYMIIVDIHHPEGPTIVECNEAACRMHGYTREELLGMSMRQLDTPAAAASMPKHMGALKTRGRATFESEHVRKDGSTFPVEVSAVKISIEGKPYVFAIERDLTMRKGLEAQMLRTEKLESLGLLAGGIAHDFNNLLTTVLGGVSLSRELVGPDNESREHLLAAEKATLAASKLTSQLLTFARGGVPVKKKMQLAELIHEAVDFASRGSKANVQAEVATDLWIVECDPGQITQVLHNLVLNAAQAMPDRGVVHVSAKNVEQRPAGDEPAAPGAAFVCIEVGDQGEGIAPEYLAKIFDPYFTTKKHGSGLGLASTHSIVKKHGGRIDVDSKPGEGTRFRVHLPALPEQQAEGRTKRPTSPSYCGRVLVMDDVRSVREATSSMLRNLGCRTVGAAEGREAIELFRAAKELGDPCTLAILDLTVPGGMGGLETFEALRKISPEVQAIVSSGYSNAPVMANYKEHGFAAVLRKPYHLDDLRQALEELPPLGGRGLDPL